MTPNLETLSARIAQLKDMGDDHPELVQRHIIPMINHLKRLKTRLKPYNIPVVGAQAISDRP
ncbi:hypothetical protein [Robiginitalea biformata]|uniref:Uncharacterized protein n=1 Tax=Robiginitalea biformata (strain ATCC BAA-864 / DSM 15991 / KCTC 12146 / HTCC2501) TaxID=313596 RepID=A4CKL5_ROBBH|nr:hypothetical protein [Robiginitalea biformata]EAR15414.1 hypothetical protein RB2501_13839 [Robiginitalea biformata HTCC2501]